MYKELHPSRREWRSELTPTGFKGYGVQTRAIKGHEFGLKLNREDKAALIAFLKTLTAGSELNSDFSKLGPALPSRQAGARA
jgi:hypothetical protein